MAILDIYNTKEPLAEITINLNYLYMRLDRNLLCDPLNDFTGIMFTVTLYDEDSEGNLDPEKAVESFSYPLDRRMLNYIHQEDNIPDYNYKLYVGNYWLRISFKYMYEYFSNPEGGKIFFSDDRTFIVDNRLPLLCSTTSSQYIKHNLLDRLESSEESSVTFFMTTDIDIDLDTFEIEDVFVNRDGFDLKQVIDKNESDYQLSFCDSVYGNLINYLIYQPETAELLYKKYDGNAPTDTVEEFKVILNKKTYSIFLKGDINFIIKKFKTEGGI